MLLVSVLLNFAVRTNPAAASERNRAMLFRAVRKGFLGQVKTLLSHGSDFNLVESRDKKGYTALHWACIKGHTDIVRFLIEAGADQNSVNNLGSSPLLLAAWKGHDEVVLVLLAAKSASNIIDQPNSVGLTPLMQASNHNKLRVCEYLLLHGADTTLRDQNGKSALNFATDSGIQDLLKGERAPSDSAAATYTAALQGIDYTQTLNHEL